MSGHTPGPWRVSSDEDGVAIRMGSTLRGLSYYDSADLWTCEADEEDELAMANAHLIAAAPDLFEALEKLHTSVSALFNPKFEEAMEATRQALLKARGQA